MKAQVLCIVALVALSAAGNAVGGDMVPQSHRGSKELERMKTLAGAWEGVDTSCMTGQTVRVEYRVTGAGSAVVETLGPGTPQEMVTVYYDKAGALYMTHYCAIGNRPQMMLKGSTADTIDLDLAPGGEVAAEREMHMHSLKITFKGPDKIVQDWALFDGGQKKSVSTFTLTRVK